jgi:hypothetical protein
MGKHHHEYFLKDKARPTYQPLPLIHSDIYRLMATSSIGGAKYFLAFTDDFSHFLSVYIIKSKDEVFGKFMEFKSLMEKHFSYLKASLRREPFIEIHNKMK